MIYRGPHNSWLDTRALSDVQNAGIFFHISRSLFQIHCTFVCNVSSNSRISSRRFSSPADLSSVEIVSFPKTGGCVNSVGRLELGAEVLKCTHRDRF
jgi:hypothetical protein